MPREEPRVVVHFHLDEENMLTVTATEVTGRGAQRQVKIQRETPGHLDPEEARPQEKEEDK